MRGKIGFEKGQVTIETYIAILAYITIMILIISSLQGILIASKSATETFKTRMAIQHATLTGTFYVLNGVALINLYNVQYPLYEVNISYMYDKALIDHGQGDIDTIRYNIEPLGGNPI